VTNHTKPVFKAHDVIHYCVPNIASRVSRTASYALSNIFTPILLSVGDRGGLEGMLVAESGVRHGVYLYNGTVTNKYVSEASGMQYRDLDLLMATRF
jgi:alanine dehydrogenase